MHNEPTAAPDNELRCSRCGRVPREDEPLVRDLPKEWEGHKFDAVCPGCQYAEWHPHCTAVRVESGYGERLDLEALERGEAVTVTIHGDPVVFRSSSDLTALPVGALGWCDYIDLSVSWIDDADEPKEWRCASCGGTSFEGVHRDYPASDLKGAAFNAELREEDTK
jgi:hypothetical protein